MTFKARASGVEHPVTALLGVGTRVAERFERLNIRSVEDLLFHLPTRYEDRTSVRPIGTLSYGERAVIVGEIELAQIRYRRRR